ncbi:hypothetical protein [Paraburkholderia heleia]|uniref:hypothetical protein n=1 Tax=Paraburkholderia heleia TaxID=634127 RepID=UPI0031DC830D
MGFGVYSEAGKLHRVPASRPGLAQARLAPANREAPPCDDVISVAQVIAAPPPRSRLRA